MQAKVFGFSTPVTLKGLKPGTLLAVELEEGERTIGFTFETEHDVLLTFEYPGWSDKRDTTVFARWPGSAETIAAKLTPGAPHTMRLRLSPSSKPRTLRLEATSDFPLAAPDTRRRAGRLIQVELQPLSRS